MREGIGAPALAVALGLAFAAPNALAEAYETNPSAVEKDEDYAAGKKALEAKNWSEAVKRFAIAAKRDPDNADLQNYLGYSYRNLKQMDLAFSHYKRSLELNPRHRGAHEYIGEAYLMVKDVAGAERHLAALREICLLPCEELTDLEKAVKAYKK
jgi:Flp pilus assembly protein TadD